MVKRDNSRTIHNSILGLKNMLGLKYIPFTNSTLNERYNCDNPISNEPYKIGHCVIGLSKSDIVKDGEISLNANEHQPYDANVYVPIPFLMIPTTEVLTSLEKSKYKLFTVVNYNGVEYHAAYAKSLSETGDSSTPSFITHNDAEGYSISSLESKNIDYLHPTPSKESVAYANTLEFISHESKVSIDISQQEMERIKGYIDIIYPERVGNDKHTIMEVGLVHSQHISSTAETPISNAQIAYFQNLTIKDMLDGGLSVSISLGDFMPLQNVGG